MKRHIQEAALFGAVGVIIDNKFKNEVAIFALPQPKIKPQHHQKIRQCNK